MDLDLVLRRVKYTRQRLPYLNEYGLAAAAHAEGIAEGPYADKESFAQCRRAPRHSSTGTRALRSSGLRNGQIATLGGICGRRVRLAVHTLLSERDSTHSITLNCQKDGESIKFFMYHCSSRFTTKTRDSPHNHPLLLLKLKGNSNTKSKPSSMSNRPDADIRISCAGKDMTKRPTKGFRFPTYNPRPNTSMSFTPPESCTAKITLRRALQLMLREHANQRSLAAKE
ncbi:hypothetical protein BDZ88DRAFT_439345 [Geranomyces variabilis]|nr:hypothetical protein BDZ88DRAFT_439345 [Geranomyces variabilis]